MPTPTPVPTVTSPYDFVPPASVGPEDMDYVVARWRRRRGVPNWDSRCNANGNGVIDVLDVLQISPDARWQRPKVGWTIMETSEVDMHRVYR